MIFSKELLQALKVTCERGSSYQTHASTKNKWYPTLVLQFSANTLLWLSWNEWAITENLVKRGPQVIWVGTGNLDVTKSQNSFRYRKKTLLFITNFLQYFLLQSCFFVSLISSISLSPQSNVSEIQRLWNSSASLSQLWTSAMK